MPAIQSSQIAIDVNPNFDAALGKNMRKLLGANVATRPVDELTDTALIHFV